MSKKALRDPRTLRRLILRDGLAFPLMVDEVEPESPPKSNIRQISYNLKRNVSSHFDAMDRDARAMGAWSAIRDRCFEDDYETTWRPTKWAYKGDKPRKLRQPLKNFLRTKLHIKGIKSDEERLEEDRAIKEILAKYPEKQIQITSPESLINYIRACPGVTASQSEILRYLKRDKLKAKYKEYRGSQKYFKKKLKSNKDAVIAQLGKCEKHIEALLENIQKAVPIEAEPRELVEERNLVLANNLVVKKCLRTAGRDGEKRVENLMVAFWEFKLMNDDCSHFLADFLSTPFQNFCKLNPTKPKKS